MVARIRRADCWIVVMRNRMEGSERHGKWEPVSRKGWVVVCPTKVDALALMIFVGSRTFGVPANMNAADPRYGEWLLSGERMRLERYTATGKGEVMFDDFMSGWQPSLDECFQGRCAHLLVEDEFLRVMRPSQFGQVIAGALRQGLTS